MFFYSPSSFHIVGPSNRLVTSNSTVGSTNQPATSRPLRILPVNNSLITTSTTTTNTHVNSSTLGPLLTSTNLPSNYQNQQNNSRVSYYLFAGGVTVDETHKVKGHLYDQSYCLKLINKGKCDRGTSG